MLKLCQENKSIKSQKNKVRGLSFISAWGGLGKITGGLCCFGKIFRGVVTLKSLLRGGGCLKLYIS